MVSKCSIDVNTLEELHTTGNLDQNLQAYLAHVSDLSVMQISFEEVGRRSAGQTLPP